MNSIQWGSKKQHPQEDGEEVVGLSHGWQPGAADGRAVE